MKTPMSNPRTALANLPGSHSQASCHLSVTPSMGASLWERLRLLASSYGSSSSLAILMPKNGEERVRNLVHRGAPRPVCKYPSFKLNRTVECESLLEVDLAILLDASPAISAFAEQAVTLCYFECGARRNHVPDYVVLVRGQLHLVEVKFKHDVDTDVQSRTARLRSLLRPMGISYRVWTEEHIRQGTWLENARQLLRRGRYSISDLELLNCYERLRSRGPSTLEQWGWHESGNHTAVGVARLILQGRARVDLSRRLSAQTRIWAVDGNCQEEVGQWPLARFV